MEALEHQQKNIEYYNYTIQNPKYPNQKIIPTSSYKFLEYHMIPKNNEQFSFVYRPGDDSFFMMSVLYQEIRQYCKKYEKTERQSNKFQQFIEKTYANNSEQLFGIVEIGSGSGILSAHFNQWLTDAGKRPDIHLATDINPDACIMSQRYFDHYDLRIEAIHSNILNNIKVPKSLQCLNTFKPSVIICNPPYIPTQLQQTVSQKKYLKNRIENTPFAQKDYKFENNMISFSWMGGTDGLQTTRKLIKSIKWSSILYIIIMIQDYVDVLKKQVMQRQSFDCLITSQIQRKFDVMQFSKKYNEDLFLVRITFLVSESNQENQQNSIAN